MLNETPRQFRKRPAIAAGALLLVLFAVWLVLFSPVSRRATLRSAAEQGAAEVIVYVTLATGQIAEPEGAGGVGAAGGTAERAGTTESLAAQVAGKSDAERTRLTLRHALNNVLNPQTDESALETSTSVLTAWASRRTDFFPKGVESESAKADYTAAVKDELMRTARKNREAYAAMTQTLGGVPSSKPAK